MNENNSYPCEFCDAIQSSGDMGNTVEFTRMVSKRLSTRVIINSENFTVIASFGQLTEGYLLVITKQHFASMSHIPEDYYGELEDLNTQIRKLLSASYGPTLVFEHGPMPFSESHSSAEGGGACVDHAHLHYVPINSWKRIHLHLNQNFHWRQVSKLKELTIQAIKSQPYFYIETPEHERMIYTVAPETPSQYIRRLIADAIGEPQKWNWREYPESERLISTVNRLQQL